MRKKSAFVVTVKLLILGLFYLGTSSALAATETKAVRTVGYLPDYDYPSIESTVNFAQLTDINYFALIPQPEGSLAFTGSGSGALLTDLREHAHQENVRVGASIGGWGMSENFAEATSPDIMPLFIKEIVAFAKKYQLDTIDIDWEYPSIEETEQFTAFIIGLRAALPETVALSICVPTGVAANGEAAGKWEQHFPPEALRAADWVNIMSYDAQVAGSVHHSPRELQKNSLNYWNELMGGDQIHKLVGGVPFYGKAENGAVMTFGRIMEEYGRVLVTDHVEFNGQEYYFNNKETIQGKTQDTIDLGALGVMIWAPTQDAALGSGSRLMDVVVETITANDLTLDKTPFATQGEKSQRKVSGKVVILLLGLLLLLLGSLFFSGRLSKLLPDLLFSKRVNPTGLAKVIGVAVGLVGVLLGLTTVLPLLVVAGLALVIICGVIYLMNT